MLFDLPAYWPKNEFKLPIVFSPPASEPKNELKVPSVFTPPEYAPKKPRAVAGAGFVVDNRLGSEREGHFQAQTDSRVILEFSAQQFGGRIANRDIAHAARDLHVATGIGAADTHGHIAIGR